MAAFLRRDAFKIGRWVTAFAFCIQCGNLVGDEAPQAGFHGVLLLQSDIQRDSVAHPSHELRALPGWGWLGLGDGSVGNAAEISADLGARLDLANDSGDSTRHEIHRLWLEHNRKSWRLRLGRQEIRFGTARVMRVLNWFESYDPRDPVSIAAGVDALMLSLVSADENLTWTSWGILSSSNSTYVLPFRSLGGRPAVGTRVSYRLPDGGHGGLALHRRLIDRSRARAAYGIFHTPGRELWEQRVGLDGFWQSAVEFWYEATLVLWQKDGMLSRSMDFVTLGLAYPWDGLKLSVEIMAAHIEGSLLTREQTNHYAASALDWSVAEGHRLEATIMTGIDVNARLLSLNYLYLWGQTQLGAGWYDHGVVEPLGGLSGTVREPPPDQGKSGVRFTMRIAL